MKIVTGAVGGAALSALLVLSTAAASDTAPEAGPPVVLPSCPGPFGSVGPTCFCARTRDNTWSITCGCRGFTPGAVVQLTSRLLPPQPPVSLALTVQGCLHAVQLSRDFLRAAAAATNLTLDVRNTQQLTWEAVSPEEDATPLHGPLSSVTARLEKVRLPRIPANFFSQRALASVEMTEVEIDEIPRAAFLSTGVAPTVSIRNSRVGVIRPGGFSYPETSTVVDLRQPQLVLADSEVADWQTAGCVGGVRLLVLRCHVTRLATRALSLTAAASLVWSSSRVEAAELGAVQASGAPPVLLINNTFHLAPPQESDGSSTGLVNFLSGDVPLSFRFTINTVLNSGASPVAPSPAMEQVVGTRLECTCQLLTWLAGSAFEDGATCAGESQSAREYLLRRCGADLDRSGGGLGTGFSGRMTLPDEAEASAASPVGWLAVVLASAALALAGLV